MGPLRKSIWFAIIWIWAVQSGHAVESPFAFAELQANRQEISVLEEVLITVSVTNAGSARAAGQVELKIDDTSSSKQNFGPLNPNESTTLRFTLRFREPGRRQITVADLPPLFITVVEKARITLRDFSVTPLELKAGHPGVASVRAFNVSLITGFIEINFKIDNKIKDSINAVLTPGQSFTFTFPFSFNERERGVHEITINDLPPVRIRATGMIVFSIPEVIDENDDLRFGDREILRAVGLWITGLEVPGTDGQRIDDGLIMQMLNHWITGTPITPSI